MKRYIKQLSIGLLALCLGVLFSQCEKDQLMTNIRDTSQGSETPQDGETVLLKESFENGIPSSWDIYDNDGDGYSWEVNTNFAGHNGGQCASSASYYNNNVGALTPENWLVTPSIYLSGNATLSYWVAVQDANWAAEHYCVAIASGGSTNYTILFEETMSAKKTQGAYYQRSVNLSAYNGQTVRIAFIHYNCTDQFWLNIDDVKIVK